MDGEDEDLSQLEQDKNNVKDDSSPPKRKRLYPGSSNKDNSSTTSTTYTIPTRNTFAILTPQTSDKDNGSNIIVVNRNQNEKTLNKKERIPAIIVKNMSRKDVAALCSSLNINEYYIKPINDSTINVYLSAVDDFKKMRKFISDKNVPAYTHDLQSENKFRVILKGLFLDQSDDLKQALRDQNILPEDITLMPTKKRRWNNEAIFILYFKKGVTNMNELRKCRFLMHTKVEWDFYSPRINGPVRCRRCQGWGHGCKNCWLDIACMYCAGEHFTKDCKHIVNGKPVNENFVPLCANCGGQHSSNFSECESLVQHLKIQESLALKNAQRMKSKVTKPAQQNISVQVPNVNAVRNRTSQQNSSNITYARMSDINSTNTHTVSNNLMSPEELLALTKEVMSNLRNCRTREDQFNVITRLAVKYVYNYESP